MKKEYINKVEIQGKIGTIRTNEINGEKVANFSIMTEMLIKLANKQIIAETTWHNAVVWEGAKIDPAIFDDAKGKIVHLSGRLRNSRYTAVDGTERTFTEIMVYELKML